MTSFALSLPPRIPDLRIAIDLNQPDFEKSTGSLGAASRNVARYKKAGP
jgi:hypothetical protein